MFVGKNSPYLELWIHDPFSADTTFFFSSLTGASTEFVVEWANHFRNVFHDEKLLLNQVDPFPMQFAEVEDSGILSTSKYVSMVILFTTYFVRVYPFPHTLNEY